MSERFSECWQLSRDWPGTTSQRQYAREALELVYNSPRHKLMQRLDRDINAKGRSYITIGFLPMDRLDVSGAGGINLSTHLQDPIIIRTWVSHGLGHVIDQRDMITPTDKAVFKMRISGHAGGDWNKEYQETFADQFRDWFISDGVDYRWLTPMLLP